MPVEIQGSSGGTWSSSKTIDLKPTLFIGLGGTGLKILARFRRRLYERFGNADHWPIYQFLGIDTNEDDLSRGGEEDGIGEPLNRADTMGIGLNSQAVSHILSNQYTFMGHIGLWLPQDVANLGAVGFTNGAGQMRSIGRLLFINKMDEFREAIQKRVAAARSPDAIKKSKKKGAELKASDKSLAPPVDVVLIGSFAGGTGSGAFLDAAYLIRAMAQENQIEIGDIRGMFLLPDIFELVLDAPKKQVAYANGYAALKELEYYNGLTRHNFPIDGWGGKTHKKLVSEKPFQVTYLFSRSNGAMLENIGEMYDLVADALAFSMSGTTLSAHMRGAWSNAKAQSYQGSLAYFLRAATEAEGGPEKEDAGDNRMYLTYEKKWSTHYSSLGISSVTMKVPELQRLAGVSLMRRLLQWEVGEAGVDATGKKIDTQNQAEAEAAKILEKRKSFLGSVRKGVAARIDKIGAATSSKQAKAASTELFEVLAQLGNGINSPEAVQGTSKNDAEKLRNQMFLLAEEDAKKLLDPDLRACFKARENVLQKASQLVKRQRESLHQATKGDKWDMFSEEAEIGGLEQWRDLDSAGVGDEWGLGTRAQRIIRKRFRESLQKQASQVLNSIDSRLHWLYLGRVLEVLSDGEDDLRRRAGAVQPWIDELKITQENLGKHFNEMRNEVVSQEYVNNQANLEAEIEKALQEENLSFEDQHLRLLQESLLKELSVQFGLGEEGPNTFGAARLDVAPRYERTLETLVDIASRVLGDRFPQERDIFEKLNADGRDPDAVTQGVMVRAHRYWTLGADPNYAKTVHNHFMAGAIEPQHPTVMQKRIVAALGNQNCDWHPSGVASGGATQGEMVLVNEAHGFSLLSLSNLAIYRAAYRDVQREGRLANRHLDKRVYRLMPDLVETTPDVAMAEIDCGDLAMIGIVLALFYWQDEAQTFKVKIPGGKNVEVGPDYRAVSRWLQSHEGQSHKERFRKKLDNWFAERREQRGTEEEAIAAQKEFITVDMCLELLKRHVYMMEGDARSTPAHTMLRRLQYQRIRGSLDVLYALHPALRGVEDAMRREIAEGLHTMAKFIGPRPPKDDKGAFARDRLLIPFRPGDKCEDEGKAVKTEALQLKWVDATVPEEVKILFPEYADQDEPGW